MKRFAPLLTTFAWLGLVFGAALSGTGCLCDDDVALAGMGCCSGDDALQAAPVQVAPELDCCATNITPNAPAAPGDAGCAAHGGDCADDCASLCSGDDAGAAPAATAEACDGPVCAPAPADTVMRAGVACPTAADTPAEEPTPPRTGERLADLQQRRE